MLHCGAPIIVLQHMPWHTNVPRHIDYIIDYLFIILLFIFLLFYNIIIIIYIIIIDYRLTCFNPIYFNNSLLYYFIGVSVHAWFTGYVIIG